MPINIKRQKVAILASVLLVALTACGDKALAPLPEDASILAFGDSLTVGKGTSINQSYPAVLATLSGREVFNRGISGETTAEGLKRLPAVLDETQPDLLLLMHGGNDILRNLSKTQAKANLQSMIDLAKGRSIPVVLVGIPEKTLFSSSAPLYQELAKENNLVFEDDIISGLLKKPSMKSDSVHFNSAGYSAIANELYSVLESNGAF